MPRRLLLFGFLAALSQFGSGCCCVRQCIANRWHACHPGCATCSPAFRIPTPRPVVAGAVYPGPAAVYGAPGPVYGGPISSGAMYPGAAAGCASCYGGPEGAAMAYAGPVGYPVGGYPVGGPVMSGPVITGPNLLHNPTIEPVPSPMPPPKN